MSTAAPSSSGSTIRIRRATSNAELKAALIRALGAEPPEYVHHGLLLGDDGTKLSKRHGASSLADLRDEGIPAEAVRAYLEELGLPRHDVHLDLPRLRRLSIEALAALSDEELAARVGAPVSVAPVLRGARDLAEARELKAVGGDLKAVRLALTGQERGPELWAVIAALPQDELLRRAALG